MVASVKVFKKCSPNGKVILYVAKREFVDHISYVEPIEGVVWVEPEYVGARRVFAQLVCQFRYGREQDEVMGLAFCKELCLDTQQVWPPGAAPDAPAPAPSRLQARLAARLGAGAAPVRLTAPSGAPASVTLAPALEDDAPPVGLHYYVKVFVGDDELDRSHRRSCIGLGVRKVQRARSAPGAPPRSRVRKDFVLAPGDLTLDVALDKQVYAAGEPLTVSVSVRNGSSRSVRRVRARVLQHVDVLLLQRGAYTNVLAQIDSQEGCPVGPGGALSLSLSLRPSLSARGDTRGVALEDVRAGAAPRLASSTLVLDPEARDAFGIVVSYCVRVKAYLGALAGELSAELPFVLLSDKCEKWSLAGAEGEGRAGGEGGAGGADSAAKFARGDTVHHQESLDQY